MTTATALSIRNAYQRLDTLSWDQLAFALGHATRSDIARPSAMWANRIDAVDTELDRRGVIAVPYGDQGQFMVGRKADFEPIR